MDLENFSICEKSNVWLTHAGWHVAWFLLDREIPNNANLAMNLLHIVIKPNDTPGIMVSCVKLSPNDLACYINHNCAGWLVRTLSIVPSGSVIVSHNVVITGVEQYWTKEKAKKKATTIEALVKQFYQTSDVTDVYQINAPLYEHQSEVVRLLIVNIDTTPLGAQPLYFEPIPRLNILCPYIIIEVTPQEFERIEKGSLSLAHGWTLGLRLG